jgi:2-C-methyl-D-erythritol 4-phosphate cytidylyltransferase
MAVALLVAAGSGERLGASGPKAFVVLGGRPMLEHALEALRAVPAVERIVVALPPGREPPPGTSGVPGGATRSASVRAALQAAGPADGEAVLVHDAARPLAEPELFVRTLAALEEHGCDGAIAAAPVTDTIKEARDGVAVERTLDRSGLWAVQTPQAFRAGALRAALHVPDEILAAATDDAWLVERAGGRVVVVPSTPANLKVTTPVDLRLAELLLAERADARLSLPRKRC